MPTFPAIARTLSQWQETLSKLRRKDETLALIPTMGALHSGHLDLVRVAQRFADTIVVSIFVNPTQFGPHEDLSKYPRSLDDDLEKLSQAGVDGVFAPSVEALYPNGFATTISLEGPAAAGLEDRFRPAHFSGVATIVAKLFIQARPDIAVFGEKDYQQLKVVQRLVADLDLAVRIIPAPTSREPNGLAMSSRNRYLSAEERKVAPLLHGSLLNCADTLKTGILPESALKTTEAHLEQAGFSLDYLEARDAQTLEPVSLFKSGSARLLVAARLGATRLIDNIAI